MTWTSRRASASALVTLDSILTPGAGLRFPTIPDDAFVNAVGCYQEGSRAYLDGWLLCTVDVTTDGIQLGTLDADWTPAATVSQVFLSTDAAGSVTPATAEAYADGSVWFFPQAARDATTGDGQFFVAVPGGFALASAFP